MQILQGNIADTNIIAARTTNMEMFFASLHYTTAGNLVVTCPLRLSRVTTVTEELSACMFLTKEACLLVNYNFSIKQYIQ